MPKRRRGEKKTTYFDYNLLFIIIFLLCFGLVMLYSSSSYTSANKYGDSAHYLKLQARNIAIGLVFMFYFAKKDYHVWRKFGRLAYWGALGFCLVVLAKVPGLTRSSHGQSRWIQVGPIGFQPSELAKIAIIIYLAMLIERIPKQLDKVSSMAKVGIFFADGCEEIEGLTVVDVVRRAGIAIDMISITGKKEVAGAHGITFAADVLAEEADFDSYDGIVLPGGMPGTLNLGKHEIVKKVITSYAAGGKLTAAICAAPSVLGENGILEGKHAVSYPGFEEKLLGARVGAEKVAVDGNIVTSRGMGTAIEFAMAIVKWLDPQADIDAMEANIMYFK